MLIKCLHGFKSIAICCSILDNCNSISVNFATPRTVIYIFLTLLLRSLKYLKCINSRRTVSNHTVLTCTEIIVIVMSNEKHTYN